MSGNVLGILIDNTIGFTPYCDKARRKLSLISITPNWGGSTGDMRAACLSQVLPILTYVPSVWAPLISRGTCNKSHMARIITGTYRATNTSSLLLEASLRRFDRYIDNRTMAAVECVRRRHNNDPLHNKSMGPTPSVRWSRKFKVQCWQQRSDSFQARYKVRFLRRIRHKLTGKLTRRPAAWSRFTSIGITQALLIIESHITLYDYRNMVASQKAKPIKVRFYPSLLEPVNPDTPAEEKKRKGGATTTRLRQRGSEWELLLDAAVVNGKGVGVAHLYTSRAPVANPKPAIQQWAAPDIRKWETFELSGEGAHSFTTECLAMKTGLRKLAKQLCPAPLHRRLLIATGCLSLVLALEKGPVNQKDPLLAHIWSSLYKLFDRGIARIPIQWVPTHCGITRNEFADARAKTLLSNCRDSDMRKVGMLFSTAVSYYKAQNRLHHHNLLAAEQTDRANLRIEDKFARAQQST